MGFAAIGNAYCIRGDMALQSIQNSFKVVDDILRRDNDSIMNPENSGDAHQVLQFWDHAQ